MREYVEKCGNEHVLVVVAKLGSYTRMDDGNGIAIL